MQAPMRRPFDEPVFLTTNWRSSLLATEPRNGSGLRNGSGAAIGPGCCQAWVVAGGHATEAEIAAGAFATGDLTDAAAAALAVGDTAAAAAAAMARGTSMNVVVLGASAIGGVARGPSAIVGADSGEGGASG